LKRDIKLLIIDDSAVVRTVLSQRLSREKGIVVLGTAIDPYFGRDKILKLKPDVIILDIEMPRMDGITFLKKIMKFHPLPVIIFSSHTPKGGELAMEALSLGAADVIPKPSEAYSIEETCGQLAEKIRILGSMSFSAGKGKQKDGPYAKTVTSTKFVQADQTELIAIGASTGGVEALGVVLADMPDSSPGIVVVQHMPPHFTASFARRINEFCAMDVSEAADGDEVVPGRIMIAPGDKHLLVKQRAGSYVVELSDGPRVCFQKPSVDVLFKSVAECAGSNALGIILTGMGRDGAEGLLTLRETGAMTIAQDEESCIVFGMPRAAIDLGGAGMILSLKDISGAILELIAPAIMSDEQNKIKAKIRRQAGIT